MKPSRSFSCFRSMSAIPSIGPSTSIQRSTCAIVSAKLCMSSWLYRVSSYWMRMLSAASPPLTKMLTGNIGVSVARSSEVISVPPIL